MEISERGGLKRREREIQTVNLTQESGGWGRGGGQNTAHEDRRSRLDFRGCFCVQSPHAVPFTRLFPQSRRIKKKRICVTSIARVAVEKNQKEMFFQLSENAAKC